MLAAVVLVLPNRSVNFEPEEPNRLVFLRVRIAVCGIPFASMASIREVGATRRDGRLVYAR